MSLEHLSYSSINMYLDCPEKWRRKYIEKEPTVSTPSLVFGSAFHGTVEQFINPENESTISDLWSANWSEQLDQPIFWGVDSPEQHFNEGVRLLTNDSIMQSITSIHPGVDELGVKIERKVELHVPGVPIPVIGYIDVILDDGTPADLKTSAKSWSEKKADEELQTLFYLAAMNQMSIPVNWKFKHIVFVKAKKEPKVQFLEHTHSPGELFFLVEIIKRVWQGIEKEAFIINPTTWKCSPTYCDFYLNCRGRYG